jgi:hypothetical protein
MSNLFAVMPGNFEWDQSSEPMLEYCQDAEFEMMIAPIKRIAPIMLVLSLIVLYGFSLSGQLHAAFVVLAKTFLVPLKPWLTAAAAGSAGHIISFIGQASWFVYPALGIVVAHKAIASARRPTHIQLGKTALTMLQRQSIRTGKRETFSCLRVRSVPWNQVTFIAVDRPGSARSIRDYKIRIYAQNVETLGRNMSDGSSEKTGP